MEKRNATLTAPDRRICVGLMLFALPLAAQTLTLQQAETMALQNHPQIQAAFTNQQTMEARSAYFPTVTAEITGSQANHDGRIGAGFLTDSALYDRFGAGFSFNQLV